MRTTISALAILCATGVLTGQRLRWNLGRFDTAHYHRQSSLSATILSPTALSPTAESEADPTTSDDGRNLLPNPSIEQVQRGNPHGWGKLFFAGQGKLAIDRKQSHAGKVSLLIHSTKPKRLKAGFDAAWIRTIKLDKHSSYRLSAWIKTKAVDRGAGAQIGIIELGRTVSSKPVVGTTAWTRVEIEFNTREHDQVRVACALGAFRLTRGRAWFDDLALVKTNTGAAPGANFANRLFQPERTIAAIRGSDLDARQQYQVRPSRDPRDLIGLLGLDLRRTMHQVKISKQAIDLRKGFERIWLDAIFGTVQPDGTQTITARFAAMKPRRVKMPKPKRANNGKLIPIKNPPALPETLVRISGSVSIKRQLNFERQRVESFDAKLIMQVAMPKTGGLLPKCEVKACRLTFDETWSWARNGTANDSQLKARIHAAIHSGARQLRSQLAKRMPNAGHLALAIMTLIKTGEDPRDPLITKALKLLRRAKLTNTYDLATAIMAIEAVYAPGGERDALIEGRLSQPTPRHPSAADTLLLEEWVKKLLGNCDQRVDSAYLRRWNYNPARRFDNSNTQYALLGLYTAMLCGVEISPTVWFAAANHWLQVQCRAEKKPVNLKLVSHQELAAAARNQRRSTGSGKARSRKTVTSGVQTPARGWSYDGPGRKPTGSMTAAGITGLVICDSALRQAKKGTRKLRRQIHVAIDGGFAWLARHFSVGRNPNAGKHWHYYYLYGLERACELNGTAILQDRRWYSEGAELLLNAQKPEGQWGSLEDTCFAILFLKKAAPPVITGR